MLFKVSHVAMHRLMKIYATLTQITVVILKKVPQRCPNRCEDLFCPHSIRLPKVTNIVRIPYQCQKTVVQGRKMHSFNSVQMFLNSCLQ